MMPARNPARRASKSWQQNNRTNHFTFVEVWKDRASLDAHKIKADTKEFRDKLGTMAGALYDGAPLPRSRVTMAQAARSSRMAESRRSTGIDAQPPARPPELRGLSRRSCV